jgi:hypothetical protein
VVFWKKSDQLLKIKDLPFCAVPFLFNQNLINMRQRTLVDLYLYPHIAKFANYHLGECPKINYRFPLVRYEERKGYEASIRREWDKKVPYRVEMYYPHPQHQCALIAMLERQFRDNMNSFIHALSLVGMSQKKALNAFFYQYGITDAEYNVESAYRLWTGSVQKKVYKNTNPKDTLIKLGWAA